MDSLSRSTPSSRQETALSVSELNREARYLLEGSFPSVLVEGEISNVAMPSSGHWYLTLKDDRAQIRCCMFRNRNMMVRFRPRDGMQVMVKGRLSLYEGRGDYQLVAERMEEMGDGALRRAFDQLKEKLLREGLFDETAKRPVPRRPRHIGVITSPTGAAIRDILSGLARRFPATRVTILPVPVQGRDSAPRIIRALQTANRRQGCLADLDVLLLSRGGGSLEDLWSFNDEALARAIRASELPVVCAVGHEVDFTIADFVADLRAATPTAAAELLSPDQQDYFQLLAAYRRQFTALMLERIASRRQRLDSLTRRLRHPGRRLQEQAQRLDELEGRLKLAFSNGLYRARSELRHLHAALMHHSPDRLIADYRRQTDQLHARLGKAMRQHLRHKQQALAASSHALQTVSPLNTLSRGYSITRQEDGQVLRDASTLTPGDRLVSQLQRGQVVSTVERVNAAGSAFPDSTVPDPAYPNNHSETDS